MSIFITKHHVLIGRVELSPYSRVRQLDFFRASSGCQLASWTMENLEYFTFLKNIT